MTFNDTIMFIEEDTSKMSNRHISKIQNKKIWKSLRTHILSRREKNKQAEVNAEILRNKKCFELKKIQENKLTLAQINGRLSELQYKRDELEQEKRTLLNQTVLLEPIALKCLRIENKLTPTNNPKKTIISASELLKKQYDIVDIINGQCSNTEISPLVDEFKPITQQSEVIPNKVNGTNKQNYWIFHSN